MSIVTAPQFPGCTVFGNSTAECCTSYPVTANTTEGSLTCNAPASRISELKQCLSPLTSGDSKKIACNSSPKTRILLGATLLASLAVILLVESA